MYSLLSALLLWAYPTNTQELRIGDRCPDQVINHVLNYKSSTVRLSDFAGKMILFDFGTTTCGPCIKLLPHIDSLQAEYGDDLQIFFVSFEPKEVVERAIARNPRLKNLKNIPIIAADTALALQFKHESAPHEAWLDKNGVLIAQTDQDYVTRENIEKVISGKKVDWPLKHEEVYDYSKPLLALNEKNIPPAVNNITGPHKLFYSSLTSSLDGVSPSLFKRVDTVNNVYHFSIINYNLIRMYITGWGYYWTQWPDSRVKVITKDSSRFYYNNKQFKQEWEARNTYCFDAIIPFNTPKEEATRKLHESLDLYLNMKSSVDTILTECWIIKKGDNIEDYNKNTFTNVEAREQARLSGTPDYRSPMNLAWAMTTDGAYPPTFDETGLSKNEVERHMVGIAEGSDFETIRTKLKYYGLELVKEKRSIPMLLIIDNN